MRKLLIHSRFFALVAILLANPAWSANYDLVITAGRVIDPETGLDAVRNLGIRNGRIVRITRRALTGTTTIDASGLVVAPGFIDAHFHWPRPMGYKLALRDGMTSALDLEFGTLGTEVAMWYAERADRTQVNFGTSSSHELARSLILDGIAARDAPVAGASRAGGSRWAEAVPAADETEKIFQTLTTGLDAGAIGIGTTLGYMPGATAAEVFDIQSLAARYGRQVSAHLRFTPGDATAEVNGAQELLANAAALGAPASVVHFNNPGWQQTYRLITALRNQGLNVWGEVYPYAAGSTTIGSVFLRPENWVEKLGKRYETTMLNPQTGEFYTLASYRRQVAEDPSAIVVLYKSDPAEIPQWLSLKGVTMGSDGMPIPGTWSWATDYASLPNSHPRGAGARGKSLRLAREHNIPLRQILSLLSYNTAKYLGDMGLEAMQQRGRLQEGMIADITIFDPQTVRDNATYQFGTRPTTGIPWVIVNGQITVNDGIVLQDVAAGQPLRFQPQASGALEK